VLSSIDSGKLVLTARRDLVTLFGQSVIYLPHNPECNADSQLRPNDFGKLYLLQKKNKPKFEIEKLQLYYYFLQDNFHLFQILRLIFCLHL